MARCQCRILADGHGESGNPDTTVAQPLQGSSVQLPSYNYAKGVLAGQGWSPDGFGTFLTASAVSGVCVVSIAGLIAGIGADRLVCCYAVGLVAADAQLLLTPRHPRPADTVSPIASSVALDAKQCRF